MSKQRGVVPYRIGIVAVAALLSATPVSAQRTGAWRHGEAVTIVASGADSISRLGIVGAIALKNGGVVFADARSRQLRYHDGTGSLTRVVSFDEAGADRTFRANVLQRVNGDSIALVALTSAIVLDGSGKVIRQIRAMSAGPRPEGIRTILGVLEDLSPVVGVLNQRFAGRDPNARWIDSMDVALYSPDMEVVRSFGRMPYIELALRDSQPVQVWLSPVGVFAASSGRFVYGFSDGYRLQEYNADAIVTRELTRPRTRTPITGEDVREFVDGWAHFRGSLPQTATCGYGRLHSSMRS